MQLFIIIQVNTIFFLAYLLYSFSNRNARNNYHIKKQHGFMATSKKGGILYRLSIKSSKIIVQHFKIPKVAQEELR